MLGPDEWKEFKKGPEYANVWNFFNNVLLNVKSLPTREDVEKKLNYKFPEGDAGDAEFGKVLNLVLVELLPCRVDCIRIKLDSIDIKYDEEILKRLDALRVFQLLHDKEEITIQLKITDTSWCSELVKVEA